MKTPVIVITKTIIPITIARNPLSPDLPFAIAFLLDV
jgi:hypothetical protein